MTAHPKEAPSGIAVHVRPLREDDLAGADRIVRLAFGTFLGLPEPETFMGDADFVSTRWKADPSAAFAAEIDGQLVGANFATNWGSVGFFGPLTVHPERWGAGIAKRLMEPVMECFERWGTRQAGLFTFPHSPKHVALYQKFGFWPAHLTAVMSRPVENAGEASWTGLSGATPSDRDAMIDACGALTNRIHDGLDVRTEILSVSTQGLGETVLVSDDSKLVGFAVCHAGPGTEAGSGACYVKFGAVHPDPQAGRSFNRLLDACNAFAAERGLSHLLAGINTARLEAYRTLLQRGFHTELQGVAMHRRSEPGYDRPGVFVLEDWR